MFVYPLQIYTKQTLLTFFHRHLTIITKYLMRSFIKLILLIKIINKCEKTDTGNKKIYGFKYSVLLQHQEVN